jgi:hypothetical protein
MAEPALISQWDDPDILEDLLSSPFYWVKPMEEVGCLELLPIHDFMEEHGYSHLYAYSPKGGEEMINYLPVGIYPEAAEESIEDRLTRLGLPVTPNNVHLYMTGFYDGNDGGTDNELDLAQVGNAYERKNTAYFVSGGQRLPGWTHEEQGSLAASNQRKQRLDDIIEFIRVIREAGDGGKTPHLIDTPRGPRFRHKWTTQITNPLLREFLPVKVTVTHNRPTTNPTVITKQLTDVKSIGNQILGVRSITTRKLNHGESLTIECEQSGDPYDRTPLALAAWAWIWKARRKYINSLKPQSIVVTTKERIPIPSTHVWLSEADMKLIRFAFRELLAHWNLPIDTLNIKEGESMDYPDKIQAKLEALTLEENQLMERPKRLMNLHRLVEIMEERDVLQRQLEEAFVVKEIHELQLENPIAHLNPCDQHVEY